MKQALLPGAGWVSHGGARPPQHAGAARRHPSLLTDPTGRASAEEIAALRGEQEKEARVDLLRRQMVRRMMNAGISNAWQAWYELWDAKKYAMQLRTVHQTFGIFGINAADHDQRSLLTWWCSDVSSSHASHNHTQRFLR